jgi:hypothetical protein
MLPNRNMHLNFVLFFDRETSIGARSAHCDGSLSSMAQPILKELSRIQWRMLASLCALFLLASIAWGHDSSATDMQAPNDNDCFPSAQRPDDQLWYVSTRGLACPSTTLLDPRVGHYRHDDGWLSSDLETLVQSPAPLTVVYVHGNRMSHDAALQRGWSVYHSIATTDAPPLRFVIWSWPSDRIHGHPLQDVRVKAYRAEEEGIFLAQFLNRLPDQPKVSLMGYSYGSRVVGGALHILGGGTIDGSGVEHKATGPTDHWLRAAFLAPAIDDYAFARGQVYQNAVGVVEQPLVTFNPCDPVLKRYDIIDRCRRHEMAMGYAGIANDGGIGAMELNVSGYIGRSHDERRYLHSSAIMNTIRPYVWWQE